MQKIALLVSIVALALSGVVLLSHLNRPSIAFIRLGAVVQEYDGMKEAQADTRNSMNSLQENVESLKQRVRDAEMTLDSARVVQSADTNQLQSILQMKFEELHRYAKSADEQITVQDQRVTEAIMKQINSAAEEYSREQGLDILMGTSTDGNIMHGEIEFDRTEDFIEYLNSWYHSGQGVLP